MADGISLADVKNQDRLRLLLNTYLTQSEDATGCILQIKIEHLEEYCKGREHEAKDATLEYVMQCAADTIHSDMIFKIEHEDAFEIVFMGAEECAQAENVFKEIVNLFEQRKEKSGVGYVCNLVAGIVKFPEDADNYSQLHSFVTFATGESCGKGRYAVTTFSKQDYDIYKEGVEFRLTLEDCVRDKCRGFFVVYQPLVSLESNKVTGAEALLRWKNENYHNASPAVFIPILEETGLIVPVGKFIMLTVMKQCKEWQKRSPGFDIHINLSFVQLNQENIFDQIMECVAETEVDPHNIVFEITESGLVLNRQWLTTLIRRLHEVGFHVALDDFGTGYSNFVYLKDYGIDMVKLDKTFINEALENKTEFELLRRIIDIVHTLDMTICLEGVETMEEITVFATEDPDYIQGYVFGRPVEPGAFEPHFHMDIRSTAYDSNAVAKGDIVGMAEAYRRRERVFLKGSNRLKKILRAVWMLIPCIMVTAMACTYMVGMSITKKGNIFLTPTLIVLAVCMICAATAELLYLIARRKEKILDKREVEQQKVIELDQYEALKDAFQQIMVVDTLKDHCTEIYRSRNIDNFRFETASYTQYRMDMLQFVPEEERENVRNSSSVANMRSILKNSPEMAFESRFVFPGQPDFYFEVIITEIDSNRFLYMMRDINDRSRRQIEANAQKDQLLDRLSKQNDVLFKHGITDDMTGVYNREGLEYYFVNLVNRAITEQKKLAYLVCDLNGLKTINDNYGHLAGDTAINGLSHVLQKLCIDPDIVARIGGDEFVYVGISGMPEEGYHAKIDEKITDYLAEENEEVNQPFTISFSYGLYYDRPTADLTIEDCMAVADEKMYAMKEEYHRIHGGEVR